jgi:Protein of unknown function (DUF4232)
VVGRPGGIGVVRTSVSVVAVCMAIAVWAVGLAGAHGTAPSAAARCATPRLVVWVAPNEGGGAAGSFFYSLNFTNLSGHACTLAGYPGVSAVDLRGRRLGSAAGRNPQVPFRVVTLRAGDTASAVLQINQAANFPSGACHRVAAAGLRVFPPNAFTSKVAPIPFSACARSGPVFLHVERVR